MKHGFYIICFFAITLSAFGQSKSLKKSVNELNKYLSIYDSLQSHGEHYYTPKFLNVTYADMIKEFGEPLEDIDSLETFDAIGIIQSKIDESLRQVLTNKKALKLDLLNTFNDNLGVVQSDDKKLYNFSINGKSGGSYQSRMSWMYYLKEDEFIEFPVHDIWALRPQETPTIFEGNGYHEIKSFFSHNKTRYLLIGSVRTCGLCFVDYVTLVHFENDNFILDFEYTIDSRDYEQKIYFDMSSKSLSIFYTTDDLNEDCFCSNEEYQNYWSGGVSNDELKDEDEMLKPQSCSCLFEFNGETFKLMKRCAEFIKTDD